MLLLYTDYLKIITFMVLQNTSVLTYILSNILLTQSLLKIFKDYWNGLFFICTSSNKQNCVLTYVSLLPPKLSSTLIKLDYCSSCQYTHGEVCQLLWLHNTLPFVLIIGGDFLKELCCNTIIPYISAFIATDLFLVTVLRGVITCWQNVAHIPVHYEP